MSADNHEHAPTEIKLHQKSRVLTVAFADGNRFELPCEYLRVFSPAAEVRAMPGPVTGKETVNISSIEPVGHYALRLYFDDGHDTGVYSWATLHDLGTNREQKWNTYLQRLEQLGLQRREPGAAESGQRTITVFYFVYLVNAFGQDTEELVLPPPVVHVRSLLSWLRGRGAEYERLLVQEHLQVAVNKQFAEPFTRLEDGDEVALVPTSPQPVDL